MNNKVIDEPNRCTGCSACQTICPVNAIYLDSDPEQRDGIVSYIQRENCIDCGACTDICPVLNNYPNINSENPACYALWADEEVLNNSSSGGAFSLFAQVVLDRGGYVCGAAYDEQFEVHHIIINKKEDLGKLRRSKYVQSRLDNIFTEIKQIISDKLLLFVGTPCQVAGLKAVTGSNRNLICIDLFCGHTPPAALFKNYINESFPTQELAAYDFRTKTNGWSSEEATVVFKNGENTILTPQNDDWQKIYHSKLCMREVCENCRFSGVPRIGDISIADFWWIEETDPDLYNELGTSAVIVNNAQGLDLFEKAKSAAECCTEVDFSAMKKNRPAHTSAHPERTRFYDLVKKRKIHEAAEMSLNHKYDIVLWGNWSEKNYGSELTYYSLYSVLTELGYEVLLVERPRDAVWGPNDKAVLFMESPYPEYACWVPETKREMYELNEMSDTFIVGSDQIWHHDLYDCFGKVCYLDFVHHDKKKISYASSFGREYWDGKKKEAEEVSLYLRDFSALSVREKSGIDLCRDLFHVKADLVLDPVFLCPVTNLIELSEKSELDKTSHLGIYILDVDKEVLAVIDTLEASLNVDSQIITDAFTKDSEKNWDREIITGASEEDWLCNIRNSAYVFTDSYHGMCLAIRFHKPFVAVSNEKRGAVRFKELLSLLGLEHRLISPEKLNQIEEIAALFSEPIDYKEVDEKLAELCENSKQWLENAIKKNIEPRMDWDVIYQREMSFLEGYIAKQNREKELLINWHTERLDHHDKIEEWHTERLDHHDKIEEWHTERLDHHDKIEKWYTERLDHHDKIEEWHTERLDHNDKIAQWHTERLDHHDKIEEWHTDWLKSMDDRMTAYEKQIKKLTSQIEEMKRSLHLLQSTPTYKILEHLKTAPLDKNKK